jgi:thiol-activated cytolysin
MYKTNFFLKKLQGFHIIFAAAFLLLSTTTGCSKTKYLEFPEITSSSITLNNKNSVKALQLADFMVMDNNYELVFLGSMINGKNIIDFSTFNPVTGYSKLPITISSSLNGSTSKTITVPRLSTFRQSVQDIIRSTSISNPDVSSFLYYYRPFYDYHELTNDFGYKVNTRSLFSTTTTSVTNQLTTIKRKNGLIVGFELINFTIDMSLPKKNELVDNITALKLVDLGSIPVYVSSISYGQKGIIAIETDYSLEETNTAFEKMTKKIFKRTTETLTNTEINIINNSTIRVFLAGGKNSGSVVQINGYHDFLEHIADVSVFSADAPGYPISFRCRKLEDFSSFKINN